MRYYCVILSLTFDVTTNPSRRTTTLKWYYMNIFIIFLLSDMILQRKFIYCTYMSLVPRSVRWFVALISHRKLVDHLWSVVGRKSGLNIFDSDSYLICLLNIWILKRDDVGYGKIFGRKLTDIKIALSIHIELYINYPI